MVEVRAAIESMTGARFVHGWGVSYVQMSRSAQHPFVSKP
jgi:hypothetical protein